MASNVSSDFLLILAIVMCCVSLFYIHLYKVIIGSEVCHPRCVFKL